MVRLLHLQPAVTISLVDINEAPANTIANATKTTAEDTAVTIDV